MAKKQLIYKDDAINAVMLANPSIAHFIKNLKSVDAEEVVRCEYCKYYDKEQSECTIKFDSVGERLAMSAQHYCSDGKRRKHGV